MRIFRKLKYLTKCLFRMNFGRMFKTVRTLAKENRKLSVVIFFDILLCGLRYGAGYVDYQIFDFVKLSAKQRRTFVTRGINNEFIRKLNNRADYHKFEDKTVFNTLFAQFVKRNWWQLPAGGEFEAVDESPPVVIVKPTNAICGQGIFKLNACDITPESYDRIVEECIVQHDEAARLHPSSVNTLRFMTIVKNGEVHVMFRALRVGSGGSVVDNFNAGGMFVLLDENGVIISDAIDKKTQMFERHPDTGVVFKGYKIPFFIEAESMVKEAALVVPGIKYVSWDVAVSPDAPVLVEGNHNPGYDLLQSKAYLKSNEFGRLPDFRKIAG
jgi:hypothetical protein